MMDNTELELRSSLREKLELTRTKLEGLSKESTVDKIPNDRMRDLVTKLEELMDVIDSGTGSCW